MSHPPETIFLNIAGFYIKISYGPTKFLYYKKKRRMEILKDYKEFITTDIPARIDYSIVFIQKNHFFIRKKNKFILISLYEELRNKRINTYYQISQLQLLLIIRSILEKLLLKIGFILHASASLIDNKAYIFLGNAGAGKSTIIKLLKGKYPSLADDIVIIKKENRKFYLYQTPFLEKNYRFFKSQQAYQLGKIFFLKKSSIYRISKENDKDIILKKLLNQLCTEKNYVKPQYKLILETIKYHDHFYSLYFGKKRNQLINLFV